MKLPTYEELDALVDTDPIKLRDVAWDLSWEITRQKVRVEDLEHELRLLRQHTADCARCQTVEDFDRDQARSNQ